ncbi:unnamed protein product [Heterobilharzia americana]|nr:unnamed protein product [Heterobilharzia americana]
MTSKWSSLNHVCHFSNPCEHCKIKSMIVMPPLSEFSVLLEWGNKKMTQHIQGTIYIHTKYEILRQNFEYYVTHGRVVVTPDPLVVNNLFPGRIIHRNIIVQNTFPTNINITKVQLHPTSTFTNNFYDTFPKDVVKFHNNKQEITVDTNFTVHPTQPINFSPNQSVLIGTVYFDLSESCIGQFTRTTAATTTSTTTTASLQPFKPYCYCGFSLDTSLGMLWLRGEETSQSVSENNYQYHINHMLIKETFTLYTELYRLWLTHFSNKNTSNHPTNNNNDNNIRGHDSKRISTSLSYELSNENVVFHSDISVQFTWPKLINPGKLSASSSKKNLTPCIVKEFSSSTVSVNRQIQIPIMSSGTSNSWDCIFQIVNPQSTLKHLFIQPILWSQVHSSYAANKTELNDLKNLTTNILHDTSLTDSLFSTNYGEFSITPYSCSCCKSTRIFDRFYPPSYLLSPDGGEQCFRLTFTPTIDSLLYSASKRNKDSVLRSLLLLRNNLTSLEPIWLEVHLSSIGLALAKVSTSTSSQSSGYVVSSEAEKRLHNVLPNFNLYVHTASSSSSSSNSGSQSGIDENSSPLLKIDQIIYETEFNLLGLSNPTKNASQQNFHRYLPLKFEFTEKSIGPFCESPNMDVMRPLRSSLKNQQDRQWNSHHHHYHHHNYQTTSINTEGLLVNLSLRRRLALINTGQVTLNIFKLYLLPSVKYSDKGWDNLTISNTSPTPSSGSSLSWMHTHASCSSSGFRVDPCILPGMMNETDVPEKNNSTSTKLLPGHHLIIELRHYPDFTHTFLTANLIIQVYPSISESNVIKWSNMQQSNYQADDNDSMFIQLPSIPLAASLNANLLGACLNLLPRPPIESFLWIMVLIFYMFNIIGILVSSYVDAKGIYTSHINLRRHIDELPGNFQPDSTKTFNLNEPTKKIHISGASPQKDLYDQSALFKSSNTNLLHSPTVATSVISSVATGNIGNEEIHTLDLMIAERTQKSKVAVNMPTTSNEQKVKHRMSNSCWDNYFKWTLGLLFVIKHVITLRWIFIGIVYPHKLIKRLGVYAGKIVYWFSSSISFFRYPHRDRLPVSNATEGVDGKSLPSNDIIAMNKKSSPGLSKQLPTDELKNNKVTSKLLPTSLPKMTSQPSDKSARVNRRKKVVYPPVDAPKLSTSNTNTSEDHSQLINRPRLTTAESPLMTPTATVTTAAVIPATTTTTCKDFSPPRMAEADIVAAVQASIRLTEDVVHHHQARRKQAQRISSRITCNSSSPSSVAGPDLEGSYCKDNRKLRPSIDMLCQNHLSSLSLDSRHKSGPTNESSSPTTVSHSTNESQDKKKNSRISALSLEKQFIDGFNNEIESSGDSQEIVGNTVTISHQNSTSTLLSSFDNKSNQLKINSSHLSHSLVDEYFEWPKETESCVVVQSTGVQHHYASGHYHPRIMWTSWDDNVSDLSTCWSQSPVFSDSFSYFIGTSSTDEAMSRLSEETQAFAESFLKESSSNVPFIYSQSFLSSQSKTAGNIHWTDWSHEFKMNDVNEDKFILHNFDPYLNLLDAVNKTDDGNNPISEDYLLHTNSSEYLSSDRGVGHDYQQSDYYYVNKNTIEAALNATLPIIYSVLLRNNYQLAGCTTIQSPSVNSPSRNDISATDNSLIVQTFLNAVYAASSQHLDEMNQSYCCTNSIDMLETTNVPTTASHEDDMKLPPFPSESVSFKETFSYDYHGDDNIENMFTGKKRNFYELLQMTEARRLSVLSYEAIKLENFTEEMKANYAYLDLVPNPLENLKVNKVNDNKMTSSWKSILDIPQSELFEEVGLSAISTSYTYPEILLEDSSVITPWNIFGKSTNRTNDADDNQDIPLSFESNSTFTATDATITTTASNNSKVIE